MKAIKRKQNPATTSKSKSKKAFFGKQLLQKKLAIGTSNDAYEVEADAVADKVINMSDTQVNTSQQSGALVQRKCTDCEEETLQKKPLAEHITPLVQKKGNTNDAGIASQALIQQISSSAGGGNKMDSSTQNYMDSRFGADFSEINIHTGAEAVQMNRELNAHAFTVGNDIYFNEGQYNPSTISGKHLLAHELTHTIQQKGRNNKVQKLSISTLSQTSGNCGQRTVKWDFVLGSAATDDGYLVQQVDIHEIKSNGCPAVSGPPAPKLTFWEAFPVKKGDTVHSLQSRIGFSDMSNFPNQGRSSGTSGAYGEVKFFLKSVTGDLGGFSTNPSTPNGWGPGKVPTSGIVPSTATQPAWWSNAPTEGPKNRSAISSWDCCSVPNSSSVVVTP